ncbi:MAG: hypothetical protein QOJ16_2367, partial [Acidobacteriota bacterium]|nr:hypothetical protein [Acidobacteriota bacterium]
MARTEPVSRRSRCFASLATIALLALSGLGRAVAAPTPTSPSTLPAPVQERAAALRDGALAGTRALEIVRSLTYEVGPRSAGSSGD